MAAFEYKALTKQGQTKKGVVEADTERQARNQLRTDGLLPVSLTTVATLENKQTASFSFLKPKIAIADLALMTRQLATLVEAALPIEEALKAVAEQTEKSRLASMVMSVRSRVVEGYTLADSMSEFPHIFDELFVAMVASGEKSGHLDVVLNRLADYTERSHELKMKVLQAMIYPIVLTLVAIGVIALLLTNVVPKVVSQFDHMKQDLPGSTQFLIAASDFMINYGLIILLLVLGGMALSQRLLQRPELRLRFDHFILSLPVVGKVVRSLNTSRFARTLSILTASSVPLLEAMRIASDVLVNKQIKGAVLDASDRVQEGSSLYLSLLNTKLFPAMMLYMIASGEKSGELEGMLERAADTQDKDFESKVTMAIGVFEPMLVVSMASIVLFIVMAILQPIMAMNNVM